MMTTEKTLGGKPEKKLKLNIRRTIPYTVYTVPTILEYHRDQRNTRHKSLSQFDPSSSQTIIFPFHDPDPAWIDRI